MKLLSTGQLACRGVSRSSPVGLGVTLARRDGGQQLPGNLGQTLQPASTTRSPFCTCSQNPHHGLRWAVAFLSIRVSRDSGSPPPPAAWNGTIPFTRIQSGFYHLTHTGGPEVPPAHASQPSVPFHAQTEQAPECTLERGVPAPVPP